MSAAAATVDETAPAKPKKSKKLLFILIGVVVLALLAGGGALYIMKRNADAAMAEDGEGVATEHHDEHKTPPTFLPLDSMVVNLADPGGNRFVQMAITLQLDEAKTGDDIKVYMPTIRNAILMVASQRTADQILQLKGKEELAADIVKEISHIMGYPVTDAHAAPKGGEGSDEKKKKRPATPTNPLRGVLFSSFIVQ